MYRIDNNRHFTNYIMKKLLLTGLAFCCILIAACKKENKNIAAELFIGAMKSGSTWAGKPAASYIPGTDTLQVQGFQASGEENLYFKLKFSKEGTYSLNSPAQAGFYTTVGMDVITSNYKLDTTLTNTVTIRNYNIYTNIANGTFQLNFVKTDGTASKLSFTGGQFYIYVQR